MTNSTDKLEKWAVIRNSSRKDIENLPKKSLTQEMIKLRQEGYRILDERDNFASFDA